MYYTPNCTEEHITNFRIGYKDISLLNFHEKFYCCVCKHKLRWIHDTMQDITLHYIVYMSPLLVVQCNTKIDLFVYFLALIAFIHLMAIKLSRNVIFSHSATQCLVSIL